MYTQQATALACVPIFAYTSRYTQLCTHDEPWLLHMCTFAGASSAKHQEAAHRAAEVSPANDIQALHSCYTLRVLGRCTRVCVSVCVSCLCVFVHM
jgi:hypothetical protein